jgi:hypothetical protein
MPEYLLADGRQRRPGLAADKKRPDQFAIHGASQVVEQKNCSQSPINLVCPLQSGMPACHCVTSAGESWL